MTFSFAYPWVLSAIALFCALFYWDWRLKKRPAIRVGGVTPFLASTRAVRRPRPDWGRLLMLAGAVVLCFALARPRYGSEKVVIRAKGIDMVLVLDVSGSMQTIDVPEKIDSDAALYDAVRKGRLKTRLEVAKEELSRFVKGRPNDRIGLVGFAPMAYNISPPTLDHAWLTGHLARLTPGVIGERTNIASALAAGIRRLADSDAKRRVLVLFTDGRNNVEAPIIPEQAAELAKSANVLIYTVGIGSSRSFIIQNNRLYPVRDDFDEPLLRKIAETTGGRYFHAADADGLKQVMRDIDKLEKTVVEQPKFIEYSEKAPQLALLAAALLIAGFLTLALRPSLP